jgi:hypothetical protein
MLVSSGVSLALSWCLVLANCEFSYTIYFSKQPANLLLLANQFYQILLDQLLLVNRIPVPLYSVAPRPALPSLPASLHCLPCSLWSCWNDSPGDYLVPCPVVYRRPHLQLVDPKTLARLVE